ncbi:unnamed protein product [Toxocara canis]|uniref:Deoxynucleotidyltransferase terminal-interacting protein 2 n=1 Tax=Toxocara canis TaxID=6265 RepID=A0A183UIT0_TOXCA|nr:unnamed protein product [Toxocara canis]
MSEAPLRRSERLRSRERSVSVEVQPNCSVETSSSNGNECGITRDTKEPKECSTPTATPSRRSRRLASLGADKDSEDAHNEKESSVQSNVSEDSTSAIASKHRRRTAGVAVEPHVEVIHEEREATGESSVNSIAYHTRSHDPGQEVEETAVITRRRSSRRVCQSKEKLSSVEKEEIDGAAESVVHVPVGGSGEQKSANAVRDMTKSEKDEIAGTAIDLRTLSAVKREGDEKSDTKEHQQLSQHAFALSREGKTLDKVLVDEEVIVVVPSLTKEDLKQKYGLELSSSECPVIGEEEPNSQRLKLECKGHYSGNDSAAKDDSLQVSSNLNVDGAEVTDESLKRNSKEANDEVKNSSSGGESFEPRNAKTVSPKKLGTSAEDTVLDISKEGSLEVAGISAEQNVILGEQSIESMNKEATKELPGNESPIQLSQAEMNEAETPEEDESTIRSGEKHSSAKQGERDSLAEISKLEQEKPGGFTEELEEIEALVDLKNKPKKKSMHASLSVDAVIRSDDEHSDRKSRQLSKKSDSSSGAEVDVLFSGGEKEKASEMLAEEVVLVSVADECASFSGDKTKLDMSDTGNGLLLIDKAEEKEKKKEREKSKFMSEESVSMVVTEDAPEVGEERQESEVGTEDTGCWPMIDSTASLWARREKPHFLIRDIMASYSFVVNLGESDTNLPDELVVGDMETIWQQIASRNKKLSKRFKKYKSLFEVRVPSGKKNKKEDTREIRFEENESEQDDIEGDGEAGDEYENADIFNLKEEDLESNAYFYSTSSKDLERELDEMKEEEAREVEGRGDEGQRSAKKYRKTIVDDRFFSLAEMEEYLNKEERNDTSKGFFDDVEDDRDGEEDVQADYHYSDFFGATETESALTDMKKKREKKKHKTMEFEESEKDGKTKKKKKSVRFAVKEESEDEEDLGDEQQFDEENMGVERVLLGAVEDERKEESEFEKRQKKIRSKIAAIEEANLAPRSWEMSGEVSSLERDENTLLEQHVAFEHSAKSAPIITVDSTAKLEALIIQRIKDKAFDDVERKVLEPETEERYRAPVEEPLVKKSLAEVYEEQFQKAQQGETKEAKVDEKIAEIEKLMSELFKKLDALSHFRYIPPEVRPEVHIVSNVASLQKEEVGPMASTDDVLMAPEEVKRHEKGEIKSKEERDHADRARERRKKKVSNFMTSIYRLFMKFKAFNYED